MEDARGEERHGASNDLVGASSSTRWRNPARLRFENDTHLCSDQEDELEHRTTASDADGGHIIIHTNGKVLGVRAFSNGQPITMDRCPAEV